MRREELGQAQSLFVREITRFLLQRKSDRRHYKERKMPTLQTHWCVRSVCMWNWERKLVQSLKYKVWDRAGFSLNNNPAPKIALFV